MKGVREGLPVHVASRATATVATDGMAGANGSLNLTRVAPGSAVIHWRLRWVKD